MTSATGSRPHFKHIFVSPRAREKYGERVETITTKFRSAEVHEIPANGSVSDDRTIVRTDAFIREAAGIPVDDVAGAVTAAKQILVLDVRSPHGLVRKFETKGGLVCPHFYIVGTMVNGCFYSCEYCYLQGTYRSVHPFIKLAINYDDVFDAMKATARKNKRADLVTNFNAGELMDSLSFEDVTGFIGELIPKMTGDDFERSELMLLTKSANVEALVSAAEEHPEAIERVIPTWSINSPRAASCYEHAAPGTEQRLEAAKRVQDAGYKTRLRIDPMVPYEGWEDDYRDLVRSIYGEYGLQPQVITLGTLRYESAVPAIARKRFRHTNLFDFPLVKKGEDKQRLRYAERLAMYRHVVDAIRAFDDDQKIGLCKERDEAWVDLGYDMAPDAPHGCNCAPQWTFNELWKHGDSRPAMRLPTGTTREIPLAELSDDRTYQYRESSYTGSLKETIIENDLVHPIVVLERENGDGREFQIVDGFRRVMAAKALGREKIKARIFSELSDEQIKRLKGISNLAVEDMDAVERFRFVKGCVQAGMTQEKIVASYSLQHRQVAKYMLLAKDEHQAIAEQLVRREISLNDAYKKAQNKEPAKPSDDLVHQCSEIERILKEAARAAFGGTSVGITVKATRGDLVSISVKGLSGTNVRESLSGYGDFLHKATTTPKPTKRPARRSRPSIKPPTKKKAPQASRLRPKKAAKRK